MYTDHSQTALSGDIAPVGLSWALTAVAAAIVIVLVVYRVATKSRRRRPW
ncbi:hypothetical protein ACFYOK_04710 [Microbispora bryophytorum]